MSINTAPLFDYEAWILQVPDYDWNTLHAETDDLIEVTADAPTFDDEADTYTIPEAEGVLYLVDGEAAVAGVVSVGDVAVSITVTAEADEGYKLTGTASWVGVFNEAAPSGE